MLLDTAKLFVPTTFDASCKRDIKLWMSLSGKCICYYKYRLWFADVMTGPYYQQCTGSSSQHNIECNFELFPLNDSTNRFVRFQSDEHGNAQLASMSRIVDDTFEHIVLFNQKDDTLAWDSFIFNEFSAAYQVIEYLAHVPVTGDYVVCTTGAFGGRSNYHLFYGPAKAMRKEDPNLIDFMRYKDGGTTYITVGNKYKLYFPSRARDWSTPSIEFLSTETGIAMNRLEVPDPIGYCRDLLGLDVSLYVDRF